MLKKIISILISVAVMAGMTACWDHVEVNEMLIVAGVGIDIDDDNDYHATVEFINLESSAEDSIKAGLLYGSGDNIYAAMEDAMLMTGGVMFGNHCKVVVVGEKLAGEGIAEVVELLLRSAKFRKGVDIIVAKDSSAQAVLEAKTLKNDVVSYELSKILKSNEDTIKNTVETGVYEIHEVLVTECSYYAVPVVSIRKNGEDDVLEIEGCGVFADDSIRGYLSGEQSKYFQLITEDNHNITLPVNAEDISNRPFDVTLTKSKVYLSPEMDGDTAVMNINIKASVTLEDSVLSRLNLSDSGVEKKLRGYIEEQISAGMMDTIGYVKQEYEADIFEFYREFQDKYRDRWPELEEHWSRYFSEMEVNATAEIVITGTGLIGNYTTNQTSPQDK